MANDLVSSADLGEYPGAPYASSVIDAAVSDIRREAGWHIAPTRTETLTLDGPDGVLLILPTRKLVEVTEIRDVSGDDPVILTGWRASVAKGMIHRSAGWPCGFAAIEVDLEHGFATCPEGLLPEVARRCQAATGTNTSSKQTIVIDDYTETTDNSESVAESASSPVADYVLLPGRV